MKMLGGATYSMVHPDACFFINCHGRYRTCDRRKPYDRVQSWDTFCDVAISLRRMSIERRKSFSSIIFIKSLSCKLDELLCFILASTDNLPRLQSCNFCLKVLSSLGTTSNN